MSVLNKYYKIKLTLIYWYGLEYNYYQYGKIDEYDENWWTMYDFDDRWTLWYLKS